MVRSDDGLLTVHEGDWNFVAEMCFLGREMLLTVMLVREIYTWGLEPFLSK
jgi:hypothetical protein